MNILEDFITLCHPSVELLLQLHVLQLSPLSLLTLLLLLLAQSCHLCTRCLCLRQPLPHLMHLVLPLTLEFVKLIRFGLDSVVEFGSFFLGCSQLVLNFC